MQTSPIHKAPGLIILLPFASGILLAHFVEILELLPYFLIIISLLTLSVIQYFKVKKYSVRNHVFLYASIVLLCALGINRYQSDTVNLELKASMNAEFCATILSCPIEKEKTFSVDIMVDSVILESMSEYMNLGAIAYFEKSENALKLIPGDRVCFYGELNAPSEPLNPEDFNYKKYLYSRHIYATTYIAAENWKKLDNNYFTLKIIANRIQNYVVGILKFQDYGDEELALVSALTVGYKELLDADQKQAYMSSGATHVLAVSGLHVGIIFIFLLRLFKLLGDTKKMKILRTILIIILLWCFAFITGLTPSVTRATLMFSMVALGQLMKARYNIYNTLFLSAFVLLFCNPQLLFSISFLLSYTALLGIVTFQPPIANFLIEKCRIPKFLSELMAVSIAAQIGTTPISIHVFNTFPNYFLLTNIWIVPLVSIIVNGAIILIIISLLNIPSGFISIPLGWLLKAMNIGVDWISQLPNALTNHLYIDEISMIFLYLIMILMLVAVHYRSKLYLTSTLFCFLLMVSYNFFLLYEEKDTHTFYTFFNREKFEICAQQGLSSDMLSDNVETMERPAYLVRHNLVRNNMTLSDIKHCYKRGNLKRNGDFVITPKALYATYSRDLECYNKIMNVEALFIVSEEPKSIYRLFKTLKFKTLVFHQRPKRYLSYYQRFCDENDINLHLMYEDGAYIAPLIP